MSDALEAMVEEVCALAVCLRRASRKSVLEPEVSLPKRELLKLLEVSPGPLTVPQLARARGTSRQNVQILVHGLALKGLVEFSANPDHRKSERLSLTAAGRTLLNRARREDRARLAKLRPHVRTEALQGCIEFLRELRERMEGTTSIRSHRRVRRRAQPGSTAEPATDQRTPPQEPSPSASPPEELPVSLL